MSRKRSPPARGDAALNQAKKDAGRGHIAVATRQKSTARRLVSSILEGTYLMVFTGGTAVTTLAVNTAPVFP
jgi:hypothetical protein